MEMKRCRYPLFEFYRGLTSSLSLLFTQLLRQPLEIIDFPLFKHLVSPCLSFDELT
jgi:hypothetical protein